MTEPAKDCWLHPDIQVRESAIAGHGLFARGFLPAGTVVSRPGGHLVDDATLRELFAEAAREHRYVDTITVGDDVHLVLPPRRPNGYGNTVTGADWLLPDLRQRYGEHWIPLLRDRIAAS